MSDQQHLKCENITCHGCGQVVPRKNAFFMYEYECCSSKCIGTLRKQRENINEGKNEHKGYSAFTFSSGGGAAC